MAKTQSADRALRPGERVVATKALRGVPEGTPGTVKVANGLTWLRYWVQFDNGEWIGSVSAADLVRQRDWEEYKRRRAEEAARPKVTTPAEPAEADTDGGKPAADGPASKVPAHLLERSQKARARKAAG